MSRLLCTIRLRRALESTKLFNPNGRTLFNTRILFDDDKNDQETSNNKTVDEVATQAANAAKKEKAQKKLKNLLQLMTSEVPDENASKIKVPRPRKGAQEKRRQVEAEYQKRQKQIEDERIGSKLEKAASQIAQRLGGDTEKTERELLEIYLGRGITQAENVKVEENILLKVSDYVNSDEGSEVDMKDLLLSLKIEKPEPEQHQSRAHRMQDYKKEAKKVFIPRMPLSRSRSNSEKVDLFGAEPLNILNTDEEVQNEPSTRSTMWEILEARDLRLSVTHPPANIFEQLISWTERGKIWRFPINNEQDWEEENVDFTEHVFLDHMLEPWCPSTGLIRHFMELVCVGLSKNPYMSVQEKHAHIIFYEHYFRHKNHLLVELGLEPIKDRPEIEEQAAVAI